MKHNSQVFIALFLFIILINISLQEGYTNKQTRMADIFSDNSGNVDNSGNINNPTNSHRWLNSDNGGSSTEFKFSENYNYKFKNKISDVGINMPTINKPDFKLYNRYWPIDS